MTTTPFHEHLLHSTEALWQRLLDHSFLAAVADNSIADDVFKRWIAQDYLFIQASVPFLGLLLTRAPARLRPNLGQSIVAFNNELELFRQQATEHGVELTDEMSPTCHAFSNFLIATAAQCPFEVGFTVLYAGEKAYFDSWSRVRTSQQAPSPWQQFINNWASDAFQGYVDWLAAELDTLAAAAPEPLRREMEQHFLATVRYEYLFWNMAAQGEQWPA